MVICSECFASQTAKFFVQLRGAPGTCELCARQVFRSLNVGEMRELFEPVMRMYGRPFMPSGLLGLGGKSLAEVMESDGLKIFEDRVPIKGRNFVLNEMMLEPNIYAEDGWLSPFDPSMTYRDPRWEEFTRDVIHRRRYTYTSSILSTLEKAADANLNFRLVMDPGRKFYRAQNHKQEDRFMPVPKERLTAPPPHLARAGRANPSGISVLYAAEDIVTAISEVRPFMGGYVSVALCTARNPLFMFDLTAKIGVSGRDPCEPSFKTEVELAILTAELDRAYAQPVAPFTPERDYAPTQIVAENLSKAGYSGIKYRSELRPGGINYAFFDPRDLGVEFHESFKVTGLDVSFEVNVLPKRLKEELDRANTGAPTTSAQNPKS